MKTKKIIVVLSLLLIISFYFSVIVMADDAVKGLNPETAMSTMKGAPSQEETTAIKPIINSIIGTIQIIGTGVALIMISVLGIKYMMAAPNDKADVKKQIAPMVIGSVILFGAVNIIQIISNFTDETFKKNA